MQRLCKLTPAEKSTFVEHQIAVWPVSLENRLFVLFFFEAHLREEILFYVLFPCIDLPAFLTCTRFSAAVLAPLL